MISIKKKMIILSILINILMITAVGAKPPFIQNMIFFGDSLSDVGNNTWIVLNDYVGSPITNPNNQKNKYIWVNYLVMQQLKKSVFPSSHANLNPLQDNISYAYSSSGTSKYYYNTDWPQDKPPQPYINSTCTQPGEIKDTVGKVISTCVPGLQKQIDNYLKQVQFKPNKNTVFFIWSGANDLLDYYTVYMSDTYARAMGRFALPARKDLDLIEQKTVDNINIAKKKLIDAGVKANRIYILNLPDLSRTPAIRTNKSWGLKVLYGKKNVEESLSSMTQGFNQKLQAQPIRDKYALPAKNFIPIENWFNDIIANPKKYDLSYIEQSCVAENAMPSCKGFIFYNAKHPTTYINQIIAKSVAGVL